MEQKQQWSNAKKKTNMQDGLRGYREPSRHFEISEWKKFGHKIINVNSQ